MAGVALAGAALLGDFAFSAFYGWRVRDHMLVAALVTALGFLVGIIGHWRLARLSRRARHAELANINRYVSSSRGVPNKKTRHERG
jgi:NhaP-type Na+/H+ or K+/H+ antiporter